MQPLKYSMSTNGNENKGIIGGILSPFIKGLAKSAIVTAKTKTELDNAGKKVLFGDYGNQIEDKTFENIEQPITTPKEENMQVSNNSTIQQAFENAKKLQEEQWAREDEIRAHVEEREDNAWQRSIRDMIKAGINPNLVNASPAASGGGISQSTGIDYTIYEKEFDQNLDLIMQEIEQNFEGSQAEKDRIKDLIKSLITGGALLGGAAIRGGK